MSMIDPATDHELRRLRRQGLEFKAQLAALERRHEQETKLLRAAIGDRTRKLEHIAAELDELKAQVRRILADSASDDQDTP